MSNKQSNKNKNNKNKQEEKKQEKQEIVAALTREDVMEMFKQQEERLARQLIKQRDHAVVERPKPAVATSGKPADPDADADDKDVVEKTMDALADLEEREALIAEKHDAARAALVVETTSVPVVAAEISAPRAFTASVSLPSGPYRTGVKEYLVNVVGRGMKIIFNDKLTFTGDADHAAMGAVAKVASARFTSRDFVDQFVGAKPGLIINVGPSYADVMAASSERQHLVMHAASSKTDAKWSGTDKVLAAELRLKGAKVVTLSEYLADKELESSGKPRVYAGYATISCESWQETMLRIDSDASVLAGRCTAKEAVVIMNDVIYHFTAEERSRMYAMFAMVIGVVCLQDPALGFMPVMTSKGWRMTHRVAGDGLYTNEILHEFQQPGMIRLTNRVDDVVCSQLKEIHFGMAMFKVNHVGSDNTGRVTYDATAVGCTPMVDSDGLLIYDYGLSYYISHEHFTGWVEKTVGRLAMEWGASSAGLDYTQASTLQSLTRAFKGKLSYGTAVNEDNVMGLLLLATYGSRSAARLVCAMAANDGRPVAARLDYLRQYRYLLEWETIKRHVLSFINPRAGDVDRRPSKERLLQFALVGAALVTLLRNRRNRRVLSVRDRFVDSCRGAIELVKLSAVNQYSAISARRPNLETEERMVDWARRAFKESALKIAGPFVHMWTVGRDAARLYLWSLPEAIAQGETQQEFAQTFSKAFAESVEYEPVVAFGNEMPGALEIFINAGVEELVKALGPWYVTGPAFALAESVLFGEWNRGAQWWPIVRRVGIHALFSSQGVLGGTVLHWLWNHICFSTFFAPAMMSRALFNHSIGRGAEARLVGELGLEYSVAAHSAGLQDLAVLGNICGLGSKEVDPATQTRFVFALTRACQEGFGGHLLGGLVPTIAYLLEHAETIVPFVPRQCVHNLRAALTRYMCRPGTFKFVKGLATPLTIATSRAWTALVSHPMYAIVLNEVELSPGCSVEEYTMHLVADKRREFAESLEQPVSPDVGLRIRVKADQKQMSFNDVPRPLPHQGVDSLPKTGPHAYSTEMTAHRNGMYTKWDKACDELAYIVEAAQTELDSEVGNARCESALVIYPFATGDDNLFITANAAVEIDISAADASATVFSQLAASRVMSRTGYWPDPFRNWGMMDVAAWCLPDYYEAMMALDIAFEPLRDISGVDTSALVEWTMASMLFKCNSERLGYRGAFAPGAFGTGTSMTNLMQTIQIALALTYAWCVVAQRLGLDLFVRSWNGLSFREVQLVRGDVRSDAHFVAATAAHEFSISCPAILSALNYNVKLIYHESRFAPRMSICSSYFWPAVHPVTKSVVFVPMIKLGRMLRRMVLLTTRLPRRQIPGVVKGMALGYLALASWMHVVELWAQRWLSFVGPNTKAIETQLFYLDLRPSIEFLPAPLDIQRAHFCAIYDCTPSIYDDLCGDIGRMHPGQFVHSAALDVMLASEQ